MTVTITPITADNLPAHIAAMMGGKAPAPSKGATGNGRRIEYKEVLEILGEGNVPLNVKFESKDKFKEAGAKWNNDLRMWYCHYSLLTNPTLSDAVSSCDKENIWPELIPATAWFSNLRTVLKKEHWEKIKKTVKANGICTNCGGRGSSIDPKKKWALEAHEEWDYNDETHTQTLLTVVALCPDCHLVRHMGFANKSGLGNATKAYFGKMRGFDAESAQFHIDHEFEVWKKRSTHEWTHDLRYLEEDFGIDASYVTQETETEVSEEAIEEIEAEQEDIYNPSEITMSNLMAARKAAFAKGWKPSTAKCTYDKNTCRFHLVITDSNSGEVAFNSAENLSIPQCSEWGSNSLILVWFRLQAYKLGYNVDLTTIELIGKDSNWCICDSDYI